MGRWSNRCCHHLLIRSISKAKDANILPAIGCQPVPIRPSQIQSPKATPHLNCIYETIKDLVGPPDMTEGALRIRRCTGASARESAGLGYDRRVR